MKRAFLRGVIPSLAAFHADQSRLAPILASKQRLFCKIEQLSYVALHPFIAPVIILLRDRRLEA